MTMIYAIWLRVKQRNIDVELYVVCLKNKEIPYTLRAQVINQYRKMWQIRS